MSSIPAASDCEPPDKASLGNCYPCECNMIERLQIQALGKEKEISASVGGGRSTLKSYIDLLPNDILLEIFFILSLTPPIDCLQMTTSAVCRRWRDLMLHSPLLWTQIHVPSITAYDTLLFFERSKPALIDVRLDAGWNAADSPKMNHVYKAIIRHSSRIRTFDIDLCEPIEIIHVFTGWEKLEAPHLKNISITSRIWDESGTALILPWPGAISLHTLKLDGFRLHHFPPLSNLRSLEINFLSSRAETCRDIFGRCPSLETLIIHHFQRPFALSDGEDIHAQINAPSLRNLAIGNQLDHEDECNCELQFLSAPNLEHLEVASFCCFLRGQHASRFLQANNIKGLRKLRIHTDKIRDHDIPFLSLLPKTTDLEFMQLPGDDEKLLLKLLQLTNVHSITLNLRDPLRWKAKLQMDLNIFSRIINTLKPKLCSPTFLRPPNGKEVPPEVIDILGCHLTVLKSLSEPGFLDDDHMYGSCLDDEEVYEDEEDDSPDYDEDLEYPEEEEYRWNRFNDASDDEDDFDIGLSESSY